VTGVATLAAGIYLGSRALAQPQYNPAGAPAAQPVAPPQTRIAIVNLDFILKHYVKMDSYRNEFKKKYQGYEEEMKQMKAKLDALQAQAQTPTATAGQREDLERQAKQIQRAMQDKNDEAKAALTKFDGDMETLIFREIEVMVQSYARSRGIELVLSYRDVSDPAEQYNPANIQRKMMMGACMPIYHHPGMDISQEVASILNSNYQRPAAPR